MSKVGQVVILLLALSFLYSTVAFVGVSIEEGNTVQGGVSRKSNELMEGESVNIKSPDVIAIQEGDKYNSDTGNVYQPEWLAKELGLFFSPPPCEKNYHRNAILSKYPIIDYASHSISYSGGLSRGILEVVIEINDVPWHFFSTHLSYRLTDELPFPIPNLEREKQAKEILDIIRNITGPIVLMGDFNARPESREIGMITEEFIDAFAMMGVGDGYTVPAWYAELLGRCGTWLKRRIDYIFVSPGIEVISCHVVQWANSSDHFPLVATLSYGDTVLKVMTYNIRYGEQRSILATLGVRGKIDLTRIADTIRSEDELS